MNERILIKTIEGMMDEVFKHYERGGRSKSNYYKDSVLQRETEGGFEIFVDVPGLYDTSIVVETEPTSDQPILTINGKLDKLDGSTEEVSQQLLISKSLFKRLDISGDKSTLKNGRLKISINKIEVEKNKISIPIALG